MNLEHEISCPLELSLAAVMNLVIGMLSIRGWALKEDLDTGLDPVSLAAFLY